MIKSTNERQHITTQFGNEGAKLHEILHPPNKEAPVPVFEPPSDTVESYIFDLPVVEPSDILPVAQYLVEKAIHRLDRRRCGLLILETEKEKGESYFGQKLLKNSSTELCIILAAAESLLPALLDGYFSGRAVAAGLCSNGAS